MSMKNTPPSYGDPAVKMKKDDERERDDVQR